METDKTHYEAWVPVLKKVQTYLIDQIQAYNEKMKSETGHGAYEHLIYRIKAPDSMNEKCTRKGYEVSAYSALRHLYDAIGLRVVCRFIHDVYANIEAIRNIPGCRVVKEKDYIKNVKPNGYRSYHMIIELEAPYEDIDGNNPGHFYAEIQLRTIAMDTWASLEHEMKYKHNIKNPELIVAELKRCADELAACDLSMQTIRNLIQDSEDDGKES
ncbi:MAG: GTP pyrophosphokinase family protein [Acidaminococcus sp.]|jgi:ppGpp synthetase/RelA/SpoT-type nucleotidyltranferase|nr:GTP pyrophosphokinase family protein [Acidaminococcus sp.]MCI2099512.1 GTP pyrophosphokinase family protein [Acidaminococcus sp.]MCI2113873.1 GTP pyrophosphokinase family protein [Acidaminococcus sp.]MCI2115554.1 GTP pyrophosphokinase family protein [Acidaminococcus sp.]